MNDWSRIYEWQMIFLGIVGIVLTVLFVRPGEYAVSAGFFSVDPFYVLLLMFAVLALRSSLGLRNSSAKARD